jgi:serine/threonine protein phosphatase PrpC
MLDLEHSELTDVGVVRDHNEDFIGHSLPATPDESRTHGWLFVVADGVGGHDRGEVASQTAVESVIEGFRAAPRWEALTASLPRIVQKANLKVYEAGRTASPGGVNMATTIVVCAFRYDRAVIAHVGDSRCYLIRHGIAQQITRDHTVVADQVRLGILSAEEAEASEKRHLLSRSLGADLFVNVEIDDHQIHADDVLLLCSDGLYGSVRPADIANIVSFNPNPAVAAAKLVEMAKQRDGGDNISVQLIRVRDVERVGMYRGRPYKLR